MDEKSREHWNAKYEIGLPSLTKQDPFFQSTYEPVVKQVFPSGGTALDMAGGLGRHAILLAQSGWHVTLVDISDVAIQDLREVAENLQLDLNLVCQDGGDYGFNDSQFDLVVLFYHLDRRLFPKLFAALKPGGLFVCKMRVRWDAALKSPFKPDPLIGRDELVSFLPDLRVVAQNQRCLGNVGVVEFVGMKTNS